HPSYDTPLIPFRLQRSKGFNLHAFNGLWDPQVDAMIDRSEQTLDRTERIKLVKDIQIALLEKYTPFVITHNAMTYAALEVREGLGGQPGVAHAADVPHRAVARQGIDAAMWRPVAILPAYPLRGEPDELWAWRQIGRSHRRTGRNETQHRQDPHEPRG